MERIKTNKHIENGKIHFYADSNSQSTAYGYDDIGRLMMIKDASGYLLKTFSYRYKNQQ